MDDNTESRRGLSSASTRGDDGARRLQHLGSAETALKKVQIVDWDGYQRIDRHEVAQGAIKGKPREKLVDVERMLDIALPKGS